MPSSRRIGLTHWTRLIIVFCIGHIRIVHPTPHSAEDTSTTTATTESSALDFQSVLRSQIAASKVRAQHQQQQQQPKWTPLLSPAGPENSLAAIRWHDVLERLLEVRCATDRMTVLLHYEKSYSRLPPNVVEILEQGRMYTEAGGPDSPDCSTTNQQDVVVEENGSLMLRFDYDDCGVEMGRGARDTMVYTVTVIVEASINISMDQSIDNQEEEENALQDIRELYRFQCIHPPDQALNANLTFNLKLSDEKYPKAYWTLPRLADLGSLVYLYSEATLAWYKDAGLHSFPVNCWTTPYRPNSGIVASGSSSSSPSTPTPKSRRKLFVKDGCPVNSANGRGLAQIHHLNGATKISVNLGQYLLFENDDEFTENGQSATSGGTNGGTRKTAMLQCEVVPCIQKFTSGILNVPKCPVSYFCAGLPHLSHALPSQLRNVPLTTVSAGPVVLKDKNEQVSRPNPNSNLNCQMACQQLAKTGTASKKVQEQHHQAQSMFIQGVKTQIVVVVALISFSFGLMVMGVLWWIHNRTDPSKSARAPTADDSIQDPPPPTASMQMPPPSWRMNRFNQQSSAQSSTNHSPAPPNSTVHSNRFLSPWRKPECTTATAALLLDPTASAQCKEAASAPDASTARRLLNTLS